MRIAALVEELSKLNLKDLEQLVTALDVSCNKFPKQLIQELGLRALRDLVRLEVSRKKGDPNKTEEEGLMDTSMCVLCGRALVDGGAKLYWPAYRIREIKPDFKGVTVYNPLSGVPHEKGDFVCRARRLCKENQKLKTMTKGESKNG